MQRNVDFSTIQPVTPPWLQQSQQPAQPIQQQQTIQQEIKPDYSSLAIKLFGKGAEMSGIFGGSAADGISSAISANGGTYVTGAGLKGTASAINTTTGAAGQTVGGWSSGLKGGLLNAGAGLIGGFAADKLFGGKQSGSLGGVGASIGMAALGPAGAALGTIFGGIAGKLFGSEDEPFVRFEQGANLSKGDHLKMQKKRVIDTPLGQFAMGFDEIKLSDATKISDAVNSSDAAVAQLFTPEQLSLAQAGVAAFETDSPMIAKAKGDRIENLFGRFLKQRYANALGGLDLDYRDTFTRVAGNENLGDTLQIMAQLNKDASSRSGVFADFNPQDNQSDYVTGYNYTETIPYQGAGIAQAIEQTRTGVVPAYGPQFDTVTGQGNRIGSQALDHLASKYDLPSRPSAPSEITFSEREQQLYSRANAGNLGALMEQRKAVAEGREYVSPKQQAMNRDLSERQKKQAEQYSKRLGEWEKQVLSAYKGASTGFSVPSIQRSQVSTQSNQPAFSPQMQINRKRIF